MLINSWKAQHKILRCKNKFSTKKIVRSFETKLQKDTGSARWWSRLILAEHPPSDKKDLP